jgi:hypothetical protein
MSIDRIPNGPRARISRRFVVNAGFGLLGAAGLAYIAREGMPVATPIDTSECMPAMGGGLLCPVPTEPLAVVSRAAGLDANTQTRATFSTDLDSHQRKTVIRDNQSVEMIGVLPEYPFNFSKDLKEAGLIPTVFQNETTQERIYKSVSYLGNLHRFLSKRPELRGPKLASLAINSSQNFPINIPEYATIYDVLEDFLKSQMFGTVKLDPKPVAKANFHLGTSNSAEFRDGMWQLVADTKFNTLVLDDREVKEASGTSYYQTTDLQLALKMLHEFSHYLQDKAIFQQIIGDDKLMQTIGRDPQKMSQAIATKVAEHKARIAREININPKDFAPNEAQANTISMQALETLNNINRTERVPGAEDDDPFPRKDESLLVVYRNSVLVNHALDRRWLLRHNW